MSQHRHIQTLLILVFLSLNLPGVAGTKAHQQIEIEQDSLVLTKKRTGKRAVIREGDKLKLWLSDKYKTLGRLKSINEDTLILTNEGDESRILIQDISQMRVYSNTMGRISGGVFMLAGIGAMSLGVLSLGVGIIGLLTTDLGAIMLFAVPVLGAGGYGIFKLGDRLVGKKFKLGSKWTIGSGLPEAD